MNATSHTKRTLSAIVLCAGKGTRMRSNIPKVLHKAAGRSLGGWCINAAFDSGADQVVVVVGHRAEDTKAGLQNESAKPLHFALQAEQNGTGHAVLCALESLDENADDVLILYGDTPLLKRESLNELLDLHQKEDALLSLWVCTPKDPFGYGRIERDDKQMVKGIVEHKDCDDEQAKIKETNPGIYVVQAAFLKEALKKLTPDNAQGELYLTDLVAMAHEHKRVAALSVSAQMTLGVNDRTQLAEATRELYARNATRAMKEGATIVNENNVFIDDTVSIGQDVTIHPNVHLRGTTRIADGVTLDTGCVLIDTIVEEGASLLPYSVCENAHIRKSASVGPFSRLRPAADVGEGAKVGNFVEMKKTRLGKGSKAGHLAYLGDATIGEGCNIGAGTITCNYDGIGKHKTELGDGVFIGSNATLVAPLKVEKNAYVAAGSTINRSIPEDALALGRTRQENKEGYAAKIRKRNERRANQKGK